jgi:alkylhydroperoxidase family enzyme
MAASEQVFEEVCSHLSATELADLTLAIATINSWNRLSIAARLVPGGYQPAKRPEVLSEA